MCARIIVIVQHSTPVPLSISKNIWVVVSESQLSANETRTNSEFAGKATPERRQVIRNLRVAVNWPSIRNLPNLISLFYFLQLFLGSGHASLVEATHYEA
jgi:hypothetical protein